MEWTESLVAAGRAVLLPLGLLAPGAALLAVLRLPRTLGTCFVASSALLFALVVAAACLRAPITGITLGGALAALTLVFAGVARLRRGTDSAPAPEATAFSGSWLRDLGPWAALYGAVWLVLGTRLVLQPLSGPDVVFRWGWLPEQMLRLGTLDFYPPRTSGDFSHYFWPESIPPGVASLYAWASACVPHPLGTSVVVALQFLTLHEFVHRTASVVAGRTAARFALLLVAATPLLNWSLLIGQETGLTALDVVGMTLGFLLWRESRAPRWLMLAGLAATVAASAREYGPLYGVAGLLALGIARASWRDVAVFAALAFVPSFAWSARCAALTGNPLYSLGFFGLPVNPIFAAYVAHTQQQHGAVLASLAGWWELARHLARWALPAIAGAGALVLLWRTPASALRWLAWFALPAVVLWATSLGFTAGGLFYSLRVLSPALALLAIAAGVGLARIEAPRARALIACAMVLLTLESWPKSLVLPENPYRMPLRDWLLAGDRLNREVQDADAALRRVLLALPRGTTILTENASLGRLLRGSDLTVVPLWSPEIAWLFDERLTPAEVAQRWRASGWRTVALTRGSTGADFLFKYARWRAPWFTLKETASAGPYLVLEIDVPPTAR